MKPIYKAPVVDQIKDLKRACEIALDMLDTLPLRNITAQDMKREGLREGEFALCDWVVRPRFEGHSCGGGVKYPVTFEDWWNSLGRNPKDPDARYFGNPLQQGGVYAMRRDFAMAVWESMGMPL